MDLTMKELGAVQVVLNQFCKKRLPRLLSMKMWVDSGNTLNEFELACLAEAIEDARRSKHFAEKHPEFKNLVTAAIELYHHITEQALSNEEVGA